MGSGIQAAKERRVVRGVTYYPVGRDLGSPAASSYFNKEDGRDYAASFESGFCFFLFRLAG